MDIKLILLLVGNLLLWLLTRSLRKKRGVHTLFIILLSSLITLTTIELAYRFIIKKDPIVTESNRNFGTYATHPTIGYMIAEPGVLEIKKTTRSGELIYQTKYQLMADTGANSFGLNHRVGYQQSASDTNELVFLGCSITFGEGLQDNETMAYKTGKGLSQNAVNLGLSGYGTQQAYSIFMNRYKGKKDGVKRTFIYSFIPDHILRAKCIYPWNLHDPYYTVQGDSLHLEGKAQKHSKYAGNYTFAKYLSVYNTFTFVTDIVTSSMIAKADKDVTNEDYQRVFYMLRDMRREMEANGDRLVIIYWNKYQWRDKDDSKIVDRARIEKELEQLNSGNSMVLPVSEAFDINDANFFFKYDGHPTAVANQKLTDLLLQHLK